MTKTAFMNESGRRLLTLTMVPAVLMAFMTLGTTPKAFGQTIVDSAVCPQAQEQALDGCQSLEGTWLYTVSIPESPDAPFVFQGTETYAPGGGYVEADQLSFTPGYLATAGHGAWQANGDKAYLLTYVNLTYDNKGNATGSSKVRQAMKLTDAGAKYTGRGDFFYYDLKGRVVGSGTFTVTAKKITVQQPAE